MSQPSKTPLVDLLRRYSREAVADITEPDGFSVHTNIGELLHQAADEIERLTDGNERWKMHINIRKDL